MPRFARLVIPGLPHHVTQRGNRRQPVFFTEDDRQAYLRALLVQTQQQGVAIWAYCLMTNHIHLVAVPARPDSLARALGEAHRRYTWQVNRRAGWTGYLWQGRFASFPMDAPHAYAAIRYVERNPVEARLVTRAEDYPWSSARAHVRGIPDPLLTPCPLQSEIADWGRFLREPIGEWGRLAEHHSRTGRPLGDTDFLARLEQMTGRRLQKRRAGRRRK
jgi:putative transposase